MGSASSEWANEPIAIIGMSCKLAGDASSPKRLWRMLAEGRSAWSKIPSSRFKLEGAYNPKHEKLSTTHVKGGYFLEEDIGLFDAAFFSYSAETAASLDPQFRLQLESTYEALENAGLPLEQIAGSNTSVFAGVFVHDYNESIMRDEDNIPRFLYTGTGPAMASNRVSHFFDFRGASMTLNTGCSTTLVALHQAIQTLRTGESDMSVIGGSNVLLNPDTFKTMSSVGFLSADGKSYAFDSRASGYGRGEGVATIVIKRLKDAIAAGDPIRAVIRETMLNQDGKTETITSPSQEAQEVLMRGCYRKAGVDPLSTQYFEAHGTGTPTGDPIEARAIASVFQPGRTEALRIGSIKTNIGHTEATSGLASIIKVVLALEEGMIPPSINFESPNPQLVLDEWCMKVATELEKWPVGPGGVRRASINNFGYGGSNAHVILDHADSWLPSVASNDDVSTRQIVNGAIDVNGDTPSSYKTKVLILSAKDEKTCQRMVSDLKEYLKQSQAVDEDKLLQSLVYTLGQRRSLFPWVAAHVVPFTQGIGEVVKALESPKFKPSRTSGRPRVGMVFTGQGAQWHAMGRELILAYPPFKKSLQEADGYLKQLGADWSLLEELSRSAETTRVNEIALSTPICVALQISLVRLLRAWGVTPTAVTSHSSGEIAAAYTVGAISYRRAMAAAYHRAVLTADKNLRGPVRGGMIAVGLGLEDTEAYLERLTCGGKAVVACVNSPSSITVAGDLSAVQEIEAMAKTDGVFTRRLKIDAAYHSHHMSPVAGPYLKALRSMPAGDTRSDFLDSIAFSSGVTGERMNSAEEIASPEHWVASLVQPVQFVEAFTDMVLRDFDPSGSSVDVVVEVGPHTALGGPIRQILELPEFKNLNLPYYGCLSRNTNARDSMQALAASLLREGHPLDLGAVNFPWGKWPYVRVLTDLPAYPWNHQIKHWLEPRFNRAIRERTQAPNNLLGSLVPGTNIDAPSWRQIVRTTEIPWIKDHVVQSNILYPAAGFISLAIEAATQLTNIETEAHAASPTGISGYRLRDIDIAKALAIPDDAAGIEIQTTLRPVSDDAIGLRDWKQFEVSSVTTENRWTLHAKGFILVESKSSSEATHLRLDKKKSLTTSYTRNIDPADMFTNLRALGITHGPMFQNIEKIIQSGRERQSMTTFIVADTSLSDEFPDNHVLHPTTLDSIVVSAYSALPGVEAREDGARLPRFIEKLWVSSNISHEVGHRFQSHCTLSHANVQSFEADISLVDGNSTDRHGKDEVVLEVQGLLFQSLGQDVLSEQPRVWEKEICTKVEWAPDLSLASPTVIEFIKKQLRHDVDPVESRVIKDLRRVCIYFAQDALASLTARDVKRLGAHHAKYYTWMQDQVQLASSGLLGPGSAEWMLDGPIERQDKIELAAKDSVNGEMVRQMGLHLRAILCQEKAPLDLMMEDNLLYRYYEHAIKSERSFQQLTKMLRHVLHKNPYARILEIGGGTGTATRHMLREIRTTESCGPLAASYHFTDISAGFFEAAQREFAAWADLLTFDKLDIEQDPASQGFALGTYDIVIACRVLHATTSMARTMANVRSLMKPGATLLLTETTNDHTDLQFIFGLLPGWWLSEEPRRKSSPNLTVPFWDEVLKGAGFTGVDIENRDCEGDTYMLSSIMSTVPLPQPPKLTLSDIVIVASGNTPPPSSWIKTLRDSISTGGPMPPVQNLESLAAAAAGLRGKVCIFIAEVEQYVLRDMNAAALEGIKTLATNCKGLIWVTRGGLVECENPNLGLAPGFVRVLRHEYVGRQFVTLDLDPNVPAWSDIGISAIVKVLESVFGNADNVYLGDAPPDDFEYAQRDGVILIPRLVKDTTRNRIVSPDAVDFSKPESIPIQPLHQTGRPLSMQIGIPGLLNTLAFGDDPWVASNDSLPSKIIEIEPRAYGVNFRDVMVAMGQLNERVTGLEGAGVITRVGSEAAEHGYAVGDHVFCLLRESFGSRARIEWTAVMRMPTGINFEEAASLPVIFATAYISLVEIAKVQRGESVLIHAAAGGVGQAAIMLAKHLGAEIFATVSVPEKRKIIMEQYGILPERIFNSRDVSFGTAILDATAGRGVDVVLNSLAGPLLQESFNVLAPFGRFVEIGKRDLELNSRLEMRPFCRSVSFSSMELLQLMRHKGRDVHRVLAEVANLIENKVLTPVHPISTYPMSDITKAFRLLQTGKHVGKVVLSVSPETLVPVLPRMPTAKLSSNVSYLLAGGVGGIGRSVAHWMVAHGARNLIVLSRSAAVSEKTDPFVAELRDIGCRVEPINCDISDAPDLAKAMRICEEKGLPPVKGVIQAAMVLQDSILEKMTLASYKATTRPKVDGTWYLHKQFEKANLDFFIMFSSVLGIIGQASQSSYAVGGTYQDALARWRVAQGLPGVSIDLPGVKTVGYVSERAGTAARVQKVGSMLIDDDQVLKVLESAILAPYDPQIIAGVNCGPGRHWDRDGEAQLGREARFLALKYRQGKNLHTDARSDSGSSSLASQLAEVRTREEAVPIIGQAIAQKLAEIFMIPMADIDLSKRPGQYGVDSLVAVELRKMLVLQAGAEVPTFAIMQSASLAALASNAAEVMPIELPVLTVKDVAAWSSWLFHNGGTFKGVWLTLAKKGASSPTSLTYAQAPDEALCHGWIDGQARKGEGDDAGVSYAQRFTPRAARSSWSKRNIEHVARLEKEGRMTEAGRSAVNAAKADGRWENAYAGQATVEPPPEFLAAVAAVPAAQATYESLSRQNRFAIYYCLKALKTQAGRERRIIAFVDMLARGKTPHPQKQRVQSSTVSEKKAPIAKTQRVVPARKSARLAQRGE
ncbi:putative FSP1 [Hypoxylon sp. FL1857]|nr:putative FSP1 [Hypoxylon sp. FL1857]